MSGVEELRDLNNRMNNEEGEGNRRMELQREIQRIQKRTQKIQRAIQTAAVDVVPFG